MWRVTRRAVKVYNKVVELNPIALSRGYECGAFPMADQDGVIDWYSVKTRALIPISGIHVSRTLSRTIRRGNFEITFDRAFADVMRHCFRPSENWLTEEFIEAYSKCHDQGWAHSCEVWNEGNLVGGIYGLAIGKSFSAESMFHRESNASKVALWAMVEKCEELGFTLFDAQIMNPHLESLGAFELPFDEFMNLLEFALSGETPWSQGRP